jgi:hypothetical protein
MSLTWELYRDDGKIKLFRFALSRYIAIGRKNYAPTFGAEHSIPACNRDSSMLATGTTGQMASCLPIRPAGAGNANSLNCRAIRFHAQAYRHLSLLSNLP